MTIGDRFTAHAGAVVRERATIGHDVKLQSGVLIGGDGFGYLPDEKGGVHAIPQTGSVILEDGVEIGANTTIDRAAVGVTRIRRAAKIDNLVQIGHGCDVGEGALLAAQVGLAGSTQVGAGAQLGGQVGAAGHLTIGAGARIAATVGHFQRRRTRSSAFRIPGGRDPHLATICRRRASPSRAASPGAPYRTTARHRREPGRLKTVFDLHLQSPAQEAIGQLPRAASRWPFPVVFPCTGLHVIFAESCSPFHPADKRGLP